MSKNQELSVIFDRLADVMEILGIDGFRINAYRRVARSLKEATQDVEAIGTDIGKLQKLPGVGKGSAERIAEYLETGRITDLEEFLEQVPAGLLPMLNISGLGPKKVALLWREAGVESLDELKKKLDEEPEAIASLKGMGKKTIENMKKNIAFAEAAGDRVNIGRALPLAQWFIEQLESIEGVQRVDYAGSLRRGKETIGDIDLLVACEADDAEAIHEAFRSLEVVTDVLGSGKTKTSVRTTEEIQVDLRTVEPHQYGAALMYFTGSKEHNVRLRERAQKQGATLNEYALKKVKDDKVIASETEEAIYKALGVAWIAPELREDRGEIDLATQDELPKLLEIHDIRADLHAHTTASDGRWSIEDLANACAERGHHTVAVTDHSKSQFQANGLDAARLKKHIKAIRAVAEKLEDTIAVLAGTEVDILADGSLDYDDDLLAELDVVVASPHAALSQDPKKATDRILKAIENPHVHIIGHPTGRLVGRREGLHPDMPTLIAAAKEHDTALEINANSWRLDLRDTHAHAAIEAGVKLSINTDAHGPPDLDQLIFGVLTARRAGVTKQDVINCLTQAQLRKWLDKARG